MKKFAIIILMAVMILTLFSCSEKKTKANEQDKLIVILHAGGGADNLTHLNAQETFEYYYALGYRYFEYDLRLSFDGRIIATHAWEHLNVADPDSLTYEEFKGLKLSNGYTPVNEEWIIETIMKFPDVSFVIDSKMDTTEGDSAVIMRLEELESIYAVDISTNIVPEIFSKEMWDICKETTTFDRYLFSHYKVYYTVDTMLEYFSDERIWGFALPTYTDADIRSQLNRVKATKNIFFFTPQNEAEVEDALSVGANGVYVDDVGILTLNDE